MLFFKNTSNYILVSLLFSYFACYSNFDVFSFLYFINSNIYLTFSLKKQEEEEKLRILVWKKPQKKISNNQRVMIRM